MLADKPQLLRRAQIRYMLVRHKRKISFREQLILGKVTFEAQSVTPSGRQSRPVFKPVYLSQPSTDLNIGARLEKALKTFSSELDFVTITALVGVLLLSYVSIHWFVQMYVTEVTILPSTDVQSTDLICSIVAELVVSNDELFLYGDGGSGKLLILNYLLKVLLVS